MIRVVAIIAVIMLTIYCVVDVAQSRRQQVRLMPHWMWSVVVICAPVVGPVAWLVGGRPETGRRRLGGAPDDDDDFLRGLG